MNRTAWVRVSWRSTLATVAGLLIVALGIVLGAAWHLDQATATGVFGRWLVPRGSALAFVAIGAALVARIRGWRRVAVGLAVIVIAAASVTLWYRAAELPGVPALAESVGAREMETARGAFPASSTALCLVLAALGIVLVGRAPGAAWSLGIAVLALAILGVTGRWLDLQSTFVGMMPLGSAVASGLLGAGLSAAAWPRRASRVDLGSRYTPYAAGATCLLATVLFWQSLVTHQRTEIRRMVEMNAIGSLAELGAFVTSIRRTLEQIAEEWEAAGRLPATQWRYQSRLLLERLGGPRSVEWIDDDFDVVYVVLPRKPGALAPTPDPAPPLDEAARRTLTAARATGNAAMTPTFLYDEDTWAVRLAVPLVRSGEPDGFVSVLFVTDEMLDALLAARIHDYLITVFDGDRQIYGPRVPATVAPRSWCRPYTLDLPGGRSWEIWVRPSAELLATIETSFPQMILFSGTLIALLLTAMLQFLDRERRTARDLVRTNRALHEEVASRRIAEQEIRMLATELEQRVRERTTELATSNLALRSENALRQRAQATLESANDNLRHFASFVSHELRQPLATMALWAELLETNPDVGLNERGHGYLKQLRASIERMTSFLEAQLRLARVTYTQPTFEEDVDVAALIREVVSDGTLGLHQLGATIEIGDVPMVRADRGQLRQLFRNLIENAVKYRLPDVPMRIRIDGSIVPSHQSRHCQIRVRDNGQGFAETDAEKIFDLFEQLPGRKKTTGSGVGLAICRRIVEHHGGTIRAEGKPGDGATFIIDLPLERCEGKRDEDAGTEVVRP
jgi:signal transduction histidine kinase